MQALRELCDTHGILLVADEVQTGFARTGRLFAMQHYAVKADLITMAKSLAGGFPLSGLWGVPKSWMPRLREDWEVLMPVIRWQ